MRVILLSMDETEFLFNTISRADISGDPVRVAVDGEGFKVKIGYGAWSPPLGVVEVDD